MGMADHNTARTVTSVSLKRYLFSRNRHYVCQMVNDLTSHLESLGSTMLNIPRSFAYSKVVSLGKDTTMTWAWQTTTLQYEFL